MHNLYTVGLRIYVRERFFSKSDFEPIKFLIEKCAKDCSWHWKLIVKLLLVLWFVLDMIIFVLII